MIRLHVRCVPAPIIHFLMMSFILIIPESFSSRVTVVSLCMFMYGIRIYVAELIIDRQCECR